LQCDFLQPRSRGFPEGQIGQPFTAGSQASNHRSARFNGLARLALAEWIAWLKPIWESTLKRANESPCYAQPALKALAYLPFGKPDKSGWRKPHCKSRIAKATRKNPIAKATSQKPYCKNRIAKTTSQKSQRKSRIALESKSSRPCRTLRAKYGRAPQYICYVSRGSLTIIFQFISLR